MARRVSTGKSSIDLKINKVTFTITDDKQLGRMTGVVEFKMRKWIDSRMMPDIDVRFNLLSCWKFPHKNAVAKAHLVYNSNNPAQRIFMENIRLLGEVHVESAEVKGGVNARFSLMADANIIRYGMASGPGVLRSYLPEERKWFMLYESKAQALAEVLNQVSTFRTIGGHKKINFSKVSDDVLKSVGFMPQPDILRRGVPMWYGDPEFAAQGTKEWVAYDVRDRNIDALLNMIQESVGAKKSVA